MTELPAALRDRLAVDLPPALHLERESTSDGGDTDKWLWRLADGAAVETVLMRYPDRATVCVSTQAGCAMACSFCATGQAGFTRHLTTGEIVEQVVRARRAALPRRLSNVVFMGMGEPLANYGPMWASVERLHHDLGLSARHLTVSTVGLVPGIRKLTAEALPVNLAVSLHAANDTPARRAGPDQPALPAGRPARRLPGLRSGQGPAPVLRVGSDRRGQRPPVGRGRAGRGGDPPRRPRQPHPPQPDARLPGARADAGRGAGLPRPAEGARRQRHRPPQPGHRHRRRLRAAGGRVRSRQAVTLAPTRRP